MPTLFELAIGGIAIVMGIAWLVWPMRSVYWYNNLIYFWVDEPETDKVSPMVARIGGALLAILGLILVLDVQF